MITTIYMIRHGETNWNKERRFQGQKDIPLNNIGYQQAESVAKRFLEELWNVDAIYASDLKRAKETADAIAKGYPKLEVKVLLGLRERYFGLLEGRKIEEIKQEYPEIHIGNLEENKDLKVEPFLLLRDRIYNSVEALCHEHVGQSIVIVSHGAAINSFLHHITNGELGTGKSRISNTSITTVLFNHSTNQWEVSNINDNLHND